MNTPATLGAQLDLLEDLLPGLAVSGLLEARRFLTRPATVEALLAHDAADHSSGAEARAAYIGARRRELLRAIDHNLAAPGRR